MNSMKTLSRILGIAGALLLASTASAQVAADLSVTLKAPVKSSGSLDPIRFTLDPESPLTKAYAATVQNAGPAHAPSVVVTFTAPAGAKVLSGKTSSGTAATCTVADDSASATCTIADLVNGATSKINFNVYVEAPESPTACPAGAVAPAGAAVTSAAVTDPDPANNNAVSEATTTAPYADLSADLTAPAQASVGQAITYTGTVTNKGPCEATGVVAEMLPSQVIKFVSGTGISAGNACTCGINTDCATTETACGVDTLAPGESVTFTQQYTVLDNPSGTMSNGDPNSLTVAADQFDPESGNDTAATSTLVQTPVSCSSTGAGGLGLLSIAAIVVLAVRRRRTA